MAAQLPLAQMSLDDKLEAMEMLWSELSKNPDQLVSPPWHLDVLQDRQQQLNEGSASFQSWEGVIGDLKDELRGRQAP